jgi:hypothetical protein
MLNCTDQASCHARQALRADRCAALGRYHTAVDDRAAHRQVLVAAGIERAGVGNTCRNGVEPPGSKHAAARIVQIIHAQDRVTTLRLQRAVAIVNAATLHSQMYGRRDQSTSIVQACAGADGGTADGGNPATAVVQRPGVDRGIPIALNRRRCWPGSR